MGVCEVVRNMPIVESMEVDDADGADGDVAKAKERSACCGTDGCQSVSPVQIVWNCMVVSPGGKEVGEHATV